MLVSVVGREAGYALDLAFQLKKVRLRNVLSWNKTLTPTACGVERASRSDS